jgi:Uma2 family endonuclease
MSAPTQAKLLTAEDLFRLPDPPDGSQQELVKGVIVTMPPPSFYHGVVCSRVALRLGIVVEQSQLGVITSNDTGVILERDPDTVRGPDLAFWKRDRAPDIRLFAYTDIPPDLAVEVLSPSDVFAKVIRKVNEYLRAGVTLVWIVIPDDQSVSVHRSGRDSVLLGVNDTLSGEDVIPGFSCKVADLFP